LLIFKSVQILLISGIILVSISNSAHTADIYKWTDKQGNVHFGDKPGNKPAALYKIPKNNTANVSITNKERTKKRKKLLDSMQADRREKEKKRKDKRHNNDVKKYNCQVAKDDVKRYQRASGIYDRNEVGEKIYLSKEERKREIQHMKDQVKKWCD